MTENQPFSSSPITALDLPAPQPSLLLVASDLTDLDRLMPFAIDQACQTGAQLMLLHVLSFTAALPVEALGVPVFGLTNPLEFAEKSLQSWCLLARRNGIDCAAMVREGDPTQQICAVARQFGASRLLLGSRGRGLIGKLLLGSVAEQVLRSTDLPVLTIGPEANLSQNPESRFVLHPTSLRDSARASAALAYQLAASQGATLALLHVLPPIDEMEKLGLPTGLDSAAMQELRQLAADTAETPLTSQRPVPVLPYVAHGKPIIEILATASELAATLIVLGVTERSAFENFTRERTAYRVLAHARCPVLTLRHAAVAQQLPPQLALQR